MVRCTFISHFYGTKIHKSIVHLYVKLKKRQIPTSVELRVVIVVVVSAAVAAADDDNDDGDKRLEYFAVKHTHNIALNLYNSECFTW